MAMSINVISPTTGEMVPTYTRLRVARCFKDIIEVHLLHFVSAIAAGSSCDPLFSEQHSLETNLDLTSKNPIAYGYKLLEASGLFPDATWNV